MGLEDVGARGQLTTGASLNVFLACLCRQCVFEDLISLRIKIKLEYKAHTGGEKEGWSCWCGKQRDN